MEDNEQHQETPEQTVPEIVDTPAVEPEVASEPETPAVEPEVPVEPEVIEAPEPVAPAPVVVTPKPDHNNTAHRTAPQTPASRWPLQPSSR